MNNKDCIVEGDQILDIGESQELNDEILDKILNALDDIEDEKVLDDWYKKILGKNGWLSQINGQLKSIGPDFRAEFGKKIQNAKGKLEDAYDIKKSVLVKNRKISIWDISAAGNVQHGTIHPLSHTANLAIDCFLSKGFQLLEGDDVETAYYNFDALNTGPMHPSRSEADTFYFKNDSIRNNTVGNNTIVNNSAVNNFGRSGTGNNLLLRTHTSSIQARALEKAGISKEPLYGVMAGNVYRRDDDVTHSPMFSQIEGIVVDENLTIQHLKGWILDFVHELLPGVEEIRFRPSFFPFTYMSAEIDIKFKGKSNWLEIMGCGMIHPAILKRANINTDDQSDNQSGKQTGKQYRGLAFGMGLERLTMLRYGLTDLRDLYRNDVRFLDTFKDLRYV